MIQGRRLRRPPGSLVCALGIVVLLGTPATASAMTDRGTLSPRLAELAKPSVRSASDQVQAQKLSLAPEGPGSLLRRGNRVLVYVHFGQGAVAAVGTLRNTGGQVVDISRRYQIDTVAAEPSELHALADVRGVEGVTEALTPIVWGSGAVPATTPYNPCFGADTSEGDVQLGAAEARAKFEVAGSGTKVGILSDSFNRDPFTPTGEAEDITSGDLPGPGNPCGDTSAVELLNDSEEGEDEGRAMGQIVHDLAPGAALSFATAFEGEPQFADNIRALANHGANVIVDDVSYLEEPFFQEGPVGVAVEEVTEGQDVAYFSAAGNDNLFEEGTGNEIGSWEAPKFRDSESCPAAVVALGSAFNPHHCMDFNPDPSPSKVDNEFEMIVAPGKALTVDLQWAEPWEGVTTDLDAFLLNAGGKLIAGSADKNITSTQRPLEIFGWENESSTPAKVWLVINRREGEGSRLKFVLAQNGGGVTAIEYKKSSEGDIVGPTIFGHNGGDHTMTVGAIRYNTTSTPEFFSSRGPVKHYFGPVTGTGPAFQLGSAEVLAKPDVVATDGGANTFFGSCVGTWRFFGTSAAAPHAAAAAALAREAVPAADAVTVEEAQRNGALPVGTSTLAEVGSGLLSVPGTLKELGAPEHSPGAVPTPAPGPGPCLPPRQPGSAPLPTEPVPQAGPTVTARPKTFIRQHPPHLIRTHGRKAKVVFRFGSNETGVNFVCRIDGAPFRPCPARLVRRFAVGSHRLQVVARNASGEGDRTPATYRFRVKRVD
jgi:hypothetical protein